MITKQEITYTPPKVEYWLDGIFQFNLDNEQELNNIRIQALNLEIQSRIHFVWNNEVIVMNDSGDLSDWPRGMYDTTGRQLYEMVKVRLKDRYPNYIGKLINS